MKLTSRDTIAKDITAKVFGQKTIWSLIFKPKEGLNFAAGSSMPTELMLYDKMIRNVTDSLRTHGAILKEVFVDIESETKKLDRTTAALYMNKIIREDLPVIFRVQVKNKNYDCQVK
jgi:hypothetical protein